jgi:hypothetical protein
VLSNSIENVEVFEDALKMAVFIAIIMVIFKNSSTDVFSNRAGQSSRTDWYISYMLAKSSKTD